MGDFWLPTDEQEDPSPVPEDLPAEQTCDLPCAVTVELHDVKA